MGKIRTGAFVALKAARLVCRLYFKYGKAMLVSKYGLVFASAFEGLANACAALEFSDDYFGEIDRTSPFGPEDIIP